MKLAFGKAAMLALLAPLVAGTATGESSALDQSQLAGGVGDRLCTGLSDRSPRGHRHRSWRTIMG